MNDGWTFTLQPYTATRTWADVVAPLTEKVEAKVTLKLEHTPDA